MNLYSPDPWRLGDLRPDPLMADKSNARDSPDFDDTIVNSQWSILNMSGSSKAEDNKKAIKKKTPKVKKMVSINASLYPSHRGDDKEYRTDYNVTNYQLPTEVSVTKVSERVKVRRAWCF